MGMVMAYTSVDLGKIEITPEMLEAGVWPIMFYDRERDSGYDLAAGIYRLMEAARIRAEANAGTGKHEGEAGGPQNVPLHGCVLGASNGGQISLLADVDGTVAISIFDKDGQHISSGRITDRRIHQAITASGQANEKGA